MWLFFLSLPFPRKSQRDENIDKHGGKNMNWMHSWNFDHYHYFNSSIYINLYSFLYDIQRNECFHSCIMWPCVYRRWLPSCSHSGHFSPYFIVYPSSMFLLLLSSSINSNRDVFFMEFRHAWRMNHAETEIHEQRQTNEIEKRLGRRKGQKLKIHILFALPKEPI